MFILTLIIFILIIGILVLVHEFGHYITARMVGIKVEEFAVGMGPRVWGWVRNNIAYNIRALPIGGFVKMYGEGDYDIKAPNSFAGKRPSLRLVVLVAGVFMNFILAMFLFALQGEHLDYKYRNIEGVFDDEFKPAFGQKTQPMIVIQTIKPDSPLAGKVEDFDIITKVNGNQYSAKDFNSFVKENKGKEITLEVVGYSSSKTKEIRVTPRTQHPENEGPLGFSYGLMSFIEYRSWEKAFAGFGQSVNSMFNIVYSIKQLVHQSFQQSSIVPVADSFGGAIGIFDILGKIMTSFGFWGVLELAALFSVNLALFNILPIPALDGGHVLFTLLEIVTRKRLNTRIYNYLTIGGFTLLMVFMIVITGLDLVKHTFVRDLFCNERRHVSFVCGLSDFR